MIKFTLPVLAKMADRDIYTSWKPHEMRRGGALLRTG